MERGGEAGGLTPGTKKDVDVLKRVFVCEITISTGCSFGRNVLIWPIVFEL